MTLEVIDFYLRVTVERATTLRMKITSADLNEGTKVTLQHILVEDPQATGKTNLKYEFYVNVENSNQRNVALELVEIFRRIGNDHLKFVASKFESKLAKYADTIFHIFHPSGEPSILSEFD